jgi:hypothetical protein
MATKVELLRLAHRLRNMRAQRRALELAIARFGDDFDPNAWEATFTSGNPDDVNRALQVTGGYEHLVNNLVELLKAGARSSGIVSGRRPRAEDCLDAIGEDGGLSKDQVDLLGRLYLVRGRLGHASLDVTAGEVREHVLLLLGSLPALIRNTVAWLKGHGMDLEAAPRAR